MAMLVITRWCVKLPEGISGISQTYWWVDGCRVSPNPPRSSALEPSGRGVSSRAQMPVIYEKGWNDHGSFWWFDHPGWECQWRWELNMMFTTQNGMLNKKTWVSFVKCCGTGTCAWTQTVTQTSWTQWYPVIRVDAYVYLASNFVDICLSSQDRKSSERCCHRFCQRVTSNIFEAS